ncbi:hypothetical protein [Rhodopirellula europaea]|uniref:Uncharacterized protein n=1 Tax=Rhodopirellula europaea 6C TaxID=1263867 RepID=M2B3Z7_9BACT|nr:hypothetical protein [Rhodopirellula europaea]EMB16463.1 hypothetical protein RE6C_02828 [Rhodopirellula europaea 6C]
MMVLKTAIQKPAIDNLRSAVVLACLFGFVGCKQETASTTPTPTVETDDHGHEHADGEEGDDHTVAGHGHGAGPHDGTIADWGGGKYHVEFTVDHDKTQATVYVLGADEKTATPIDAETIDLAITDPQMSIMLEAVPEESDPPGKSSRFIGTHEKLGVVQEYAGTMTGVIDGTPYSGDFSEEAHGHE